MLTSTEAARARLDAYAARTAGRRTEATERHLDLLRAEWELGQLTEAGAVRRVQRQSQMPGRRWTIDAAGYKGERSYRTVRELEAFVHGAQAGLAAAEALLAAAREVVDAHEELGHTDARFADAEWEIREAALNRLAALLPAD